MPTALLGRLGILCALFAMAALPALAQGQREEPDQQAWKQEIQGRAKVIDGDSLVIRGKPVRLHGIDAPEGRQECLDADRRSWPCGREATKALKGHVDGQSVRCEPEEVDAYKRIVATCFLGKQDLSEWMTLRGWAVAYRRYSSHYVQDELRARMNQAGIWSGDFEEPEDWRRSRRRGHPKDSASTPSTRP